MITSLFIPNLDILDDLMNQLLVFTLFLLAILMAKKVDIRNAEVHKAM